MLATKRSPGPPWLPIAPFADRATLHCGGLGSALAGDAEFVAAFVMVDRSFAIVSASAWTPGGEFGNCIGRDAVTVPNGAEWWALGVSLTAGQLPQGLQPSDVFRVRWELHL